MQRGEDTVKTKQIYKKRSQFSAVWRRLKKNKLAMLGLVILTAMILIAVCADLLADYDTAVIGPEHGRAAAGPLGPATGSAPTSLPGRAGPGIIHGSRLSLSLSIIAMTVAVAIGSCIGAVAGYYGGRVDDVLMRLMDILLAIPPMLMSISIVAALGQSMVNLLIALAIAYIPVFARVIRSTILSIKGQEFVEAARACGTGNARIILRHIIPNAIGPIIVEATLTMGAAILIISSLSFMGLGIQPAGARVGHHAL